MNTHPKTPHILKKLRKSVSNSREDTVLNKRKLKLCVLAPPLKQGFGSMASDYFSRTWVKSASLMLSSLLLKVDSVLHQSYLQQLSRDSNKTRLTRPLVCKLCKVQSSIVTCILAAPLSAQPYCRVRTTPTPYPPPPPHPVKSLNSWEGTKNLEEAFSISLEMSKLHGRLWVFYDLL